MDEMFQHLTDGLVDGVYIYRDGEFLYVNAMFADIFGYTTEEFLSAKVTLLDLFLPEDHPAAKEKLMAWNKLEIAGNATFTTRCLRKDGRMIDVEFVVRLIEFNTQTVVIGCVIDVTDRVTAEKYKSLFDHNSNAIFSMDLEGNFTGANLACEQITGYSAKEFMRLNFKTLLSEHELAVTRSCMDLAVQNQTSQNYEITFRHKKGEMLNLHVVIIPMVVEGDMIGIFGMIKDISEQKRAQKQLAETENKFQALIQRTSDVIAIIDQQSMIRYISPTIEKVLGFKPEDLLKQDNEHLMEMNRSIATLLRADSDQECCEIRLLHADGGWRTLEITKTDMFDEPSINGLFVIMRDITEKKEAYQLVHRMEYYDYLTGMPNRKHFEKELEIELIHAKNKLRPLAVLFFDVDQFKFFNETLGHEIGDKLIQEVSKKIKEVAGSSHFVARLAGDEFSFLIKNMKSDETALHLARQWQDLFQQPIWVDAYEFHISSSVGISIYPEAGDTVHALMKNAEIALRQAKNPGKDKIQVFNSKMNVETFKSYALQNDLRRALLYDEFRIHYQPRIETKSNRIIGAEALIRWEHPIWGEVQPIEFISIAEKNGLIVQIGEWVFEHVCRQIKEWQSIGMPLIKVSINFSAVQFSQPDLLEFVQSMVIKYDIPPMWLEIEVTETVLMENEAQIYHIIDGLKALGFSIALDDFGTGYSSLNYLRKYKVDTVKIDKSFIKNITENAESLEIVKFIIALAKKLNRKVVAEGVETLEQLRLIQKYDCDELQGYYFSRPLPTDLFASLLSSGVCKPDISIKKNVEKVKENRRKYFRIHLEPVISADMTVLSIGGAEVQVGATEVYINDIGPGGVKFTSNIRLPKKREITLGFSMILMGEKVSFFGCLAWCEELKDGQFQYGLEFTIDDATRTQLTKVLNRMQNHLRNGLM